MRRETALYHTVAHTLVRRPGLLERRIYVLYTLSGEGHTPTALVPLVEYVLEHGRTRSLGWQRELVRAVGLFVDFLHANTDQFREMKSRPLVLAAFADALVEGTMDRGGEDKSGLFWESKTIARATVLLNAVTGFSDWLVNRYDATALNPWKAANVAEQIAYWRRFEQRRAHALLSHTMSRDAQEPRSEQARTVQIRRKAATIVPSSPPKTFPDERMQDLIMTGFATVGMPSSLPWHSRINVRDAMITILLHGGGLRESEPFHLFVSDVAIDPRNSNSALVRLYHPEQGAAPDDFVDPLTKKLIPGDREGYLIKKWNLEPRNLVHGRFHAGWKDLQLTDQRGKYAMVHWFPSFWGEAFLQLFRVYITQDRSRHCPHPYLFVSKKETVAGDPYTVDSFRQAHAKAVRRIGLEPSKSLGTTPHGHRHAFGQALVNAGVDRMVVQQALHHKSIESQTPYTMPTADQVAMALKDAEIRLRGAGALAAGSPIETG